MSQPWAPQIIVDDSLAKQLIESQFSELKPVALHFLGSGWHNTAYRVNHDYVFRFPRQEIAVTLQEAEWRVLPKIIHRLPLTISVPLFQGKPTTNYPWPFSGYRFLDGIDACTARITRSASSWKRSSGFPTVLMSFRLMSPSPP